MTDLSLRERAALDVLNRLPVGWRVGVASFDPGSHRWRVTARGSHPGRGKAPETITGTGADELSAMADLALRLDERRRAARLEAIERRGRLAYLAGAEQQSQRSADRPLSGDELERVLRRYPEDPGE